MKRVWWGRESVLVPVLALLTLSACDLDQRPGVGTGTGSVPDIQTPEDLPFDWDEPDESDYTPPEGWVMVIIERVEDSETGAPLPGAAVTFGASRQIWQGSDVQFFQELQDADEDTAVDLVASLEGYEEARLPLTLSRANPVVREVMDLTPIPQEPEDEPESVTPPPDPEETAEDPDTGPSEELLTLRVTSDPSQAVVTFRDARGGGGTVTSVTTPGQVQLPRRFYSWEIQREGYAPLRSTEEFDLVTESPGDFHRTLVPVDVGARVREGHEAFEAGNWSAAVQAYEQVPEPADIQTSAGRDYIFLRNRLGLSLLELQEPARAIEVFQGITQSDSRQWAAFLNLGRAQVLVGQCQEARRNLTRVNGTLINSVPTDERPQVIGLVLYFTARCAVDEFDRARDETIRLRWGALALGELTEFLNHMERTGVQDAFLSQAEQEAVGERRRIEGALEP